jgi:trehalose synthase
LARWRATILKDGSRLKRCRKKARAIDPDLFVFTNVAGVGSMEVNVFQRGCDVVVQKSIREGFGLVVAEALWKEKAVVAGRAGRIPTQFPEGFDRYLMTDVDGCAAAVIHLLRHYGERSRYWRPV